MTVRQTTDRKHAREIRAKLAENGGYCPCRIDKTPDTKCICKDFIEQLERGETGNCHCGLYEISDVD